MLEYIFDNIAYILYNTYSNERERGTWCQLQCEQAI